MRETTFITSDSEQESSNIFIENSSEMFPREHCGDYLPNNLAQYPITLYPVFVNNPGDNEKGREIIEKIRSDFCEKAFSESFFYHKQYEIASFINKNKAETFQRDIERALKVNTEIGDPIIIKYPPPQKALLKTKEEIGKAAKLTPSEIEKLIFLEKIEVDYGSEVKLEKIKAIVPTYLPPNFNVDRIEINVEPWSSKYLIAYKDLNNHCFQVGDTGGRGDAPALHDTIKKVHSPHLGSVELGYTRQHEWASGTLISFDWVVIDQAGQRVIQENIGDSDEGEYILFFSSEDKAQECNAVSLEEAIKIVQSLQVLNP